ncbi:MAG: hypothetical protein LC114_22370 [Bryobacterales bacterium]|nr:hypothetical protein [Bryobacterales bacterium]
MALLNELICYADVATNLSNSVFLGGAPEAKELLPNGARLFRFSRIVQPSITCEWWMHFDDFVLQDRRVIPGFGSFLHQSGCRIDNNGRFIPANDLKLTCAAPGSRMMLVRLNTPVYAFMGASTVQRPDPAEPGLALHGGEFRVWIPGILARNMNLLSTPHHFLAEPAEKESEDCGETGETGA